MQRTDIIVAHALCDFLSNSFVGRKRWGHKGVGQIMCIIPAYLRSLRGIIPLVSPGNAPALHQILIVSRRHKQMLRGGNKQTNILKHKRTPTQNKQKNHKPNQPNQTQKNSQQNKYFPDFVQSEFRIKLYSLFHQYKYSPLLIPCPKNWSCCVLFI